MHPLGREEHSQSPLLPGEGGADLLVAFLHVSELPLKLDAEEPLFSCKFRTHVKLMAL